MKEPEVDTAEALKDLLGTVCKACGNPKPRGKSHCRPCYMSLPKTLQKRLYLRVGSGYEEAYSESLSTLRAMLRGKRT